MNITSGIGSQIQAVSVPAPAESVKPAGDSGSATATVAAQTDAAKLTPTASLISQTLNTPDVRASQVQAIQQAIAAGTYAVPASAVADKLIESMLS